LTRRYTLETSADLNGPAWGPVAGQQNQAAAGAVNVPTTGDENAYRLRVWLE
jgi:hypothetical protein